MVKHAENAVSMDQSRRSDTINMLNSGVFTAGTMMMMYGDITESLSDTIMTVKNKTRGFTN